jgi:hypothetical protein
MGINGLFRGLLVSSAFLFGGFGCYDESSIERKESELVLDNNSGIERDDVILEKDLVYGSDLDFLDGLDDSDVRKVPDVLSISYGREGLDYKVFERGLFYERFSDEIGIDIEMDLMEGVPKRELWEFPDDSDSLWLESSLFSKGLVKIASFNVQVFGKSKRDDGEVMKGIGSMILLGVRELGGLGLRRDMGLFMIESWFL